MWIWTAFSQRWRCATIRLRDIPIATLLAAAADDRGDPAHNQLSRARRDLAYVALCRQGMALKLLCISPCFGALLTPTKPPNHIPRNFFSRYTSRIEPLSLDEALSRCHPTGVHCHGSDPHRRNPPGDLRRGCQLTASAGVAPVSFSPKSPPT